jgi:hypothetical protein
MGGDGYNRHQCHDVVESPHSASVRLHVEGDVDQYVVIAECTTVSFVATLMQPAFRTRSVLVLARFSVFAIR